MSTRPRAPRGSLSRAKVVEAALVLADREGLAALTIRALADELGARPMSLYHHVAGKEELLDALVDLVFAEMERPDPAVGDWRAELTRRSESVRAVLLRHPWAISLLESRTSPARPATLAHHEAVLATLLAAGCPPALAARCYVVLDAYVYGFALQEATLPDADPRSPAGLALGDALAGPAYPSVRVVHESVRDGAGLDLGPSFLPGLELVLDGVERWLAAERA